MSTLKSPQTPRALSVSTLRRRARLGVFGVAGVLALGVVLLMAVATLWPGLLAPGDPDAINPRDAFAAPSLTHWFGTDESGRDVFTRVVHGTRQSLGIGAAATGIGVGIGLVIGLLAGLGPRRLDGALSRVIEVLFALPSLVLALLLVAVMGAGVTPTLIAVGLATAPGYARILRSQVRSVAASSYVEAARLEGQPALLVFAKHIAPNTLWPLVAVATLGVGQAIVWVSASAPFPRRPSGAPWSTAVACTWCARGGSRWHPGSPSPSPPQP
jgi:peptide/nickel transport system permease protein